MPHIGCRTAQTPPLEIQGEQCHCLVKMSVRIYRLQVCSVSSSLGANKARYPLYQILGLPCLTLLSSTANLPYNTRYPASGRCRVSVSHAQRPAGLAGIHSFCPTSMRFGFVIVAKVESTAALALVPSMIRVYRFGSP